MPTSRPSKVPGLQAAVAAGRPLAPIAERPSAPVAAVAPAAPPPVPAPAPLAGPPPRPPKPVRFTLDLDWELHRFLKRFAVDTSTDAAAVMRALLARLRDDPELAQQVQAGIWASR